MPSKAQVMQVLERLKAVQADYPPELLSARRAAFLAQIEERNRVEVAEEQPVENGMLISLLDRLKSIEIEYPLKLWVARRTAFLAQVSRDSVSILDALRSAFRNLIDQVKTPQAPMRQLMRSSLILVGILIAAFVGSVLYGNQGGTLINSPIARENSPQAVLATATSGTAEVVCKPGYSPPLCLAQEFDKTQDLTFAGNGSARPAVAKDTMPGFKDIHRASYVNDGLYGAGASWVSNSAYSWIKIDLGKSATINTVTFGRDRLGNYNDRDPGQFVIAVALSDNIYADGNSTNDFAEYKAVYDSRKTGFDGDVAGSETIKANFAPVEARFVKITFQNSGTAIDEVEAFMVQPPSYVYIPTKARENQPRPTWTPVPTDTLVPTSTLPSNAHSNEYAAPHLDADAIANRYTCTTHEYVGSDKHVTSNSRSDEYVGSNVHSDEYAAPDPDSNSGADRYTRTTHEYRGAAHLHIDTANGYLGAADEYLSAANEYLGAADRHICATGWHACTVFPSH